MKVTAFGSEVSHPEVREVAFALLNVATTMQRAELQSAQALANPSPRELAEARAAANRVKDAVATYNCLVAALRK